MNETTLQFPNIIEQHGCPKDKAMNILRPLPANSRQYALDYVAVEIQAGLCGQRHPIEDVPMCLEWAVEDLLAPVSAERKFIMRDKTMNEATLRFPEIIAEHGCPKRIAMNILQRLPPESRQYALDDISVRIRAGLRGDRYPVEDASTVLQWIVDDLLTQDSDKEGVTNDG